MDSWLTSTQIPGLIADLRTLIQAYTKLVNAAVKRTESVPAREAPSLDAILSNIKPA